MGDTPWEEHLTLLGRFLVLQDLPGLLALLARLALTARLVLLVHLVPLALLVLRATLDLILILISPSSQQLRVPDL